MHPRLGIYFQNEAYRYSIEHMLLILEEERRYLALAVPGPDGVPQEKAGLPWYLSYCMARYEAGEWPWRTVDQKMKRYSEFRRRWQALRPHSH